jgi:hypothetical protein
MRQVDGGADCRGGSPDPGPGMAQSLGADVPFTMLSASEVFSLSVRARA